MLISWSTGVRSLRAVPEERSLFYASKRGSCCCRYAASILMLKFVYVARLCSATSRVAYIRSLNSERYKRRRSRLYVRLSSVALVHPLTLALFGMPIPTAAVEPASTGKIAPVIHLAWSLARKVTAHAASHPFPSVPSKLLFRRASRASSLMPPAYIIGVYSICVGISTNNH